jgi:hypothetical protein
MSTKIPDTIPGVIKPESTSDLSPVDIGGVIYKKSDYNGDLIICGIAAVGSLGANIARLQFCDFLDNYNVLGTIEASGLGFDIQEVSIGNPTVDENGFSCIAIRFYTLTEGTAMVTWAGVKVG